MAASKKAMAKSKGKPKSKAAAKKVVKFKVAKAAKDAIVPPKVKKA